MVVRAVLGHNAQVPAGIWPYNYLWYALDNDFTGGADLSFPTLPCPRGDMAMMVYATMQVDQLKADGDVVDGSSVLYERLFTDDTLLDYTVGTTTNTVDFDDYDTGVPLAAKVVLAKALSLEGLRNLPVDFIFDKSHHLSTAKVIFIGATGGESSAFTGGFVQDLYTPDGDTTGYEYLLFDDDTVIPYVGPVTTKINGALHGSGNFDETDLEDGWFDVVTVTKNDDGFAVNLDCKRPYDNFGGAYGLWAWVTKVTPAAKVTDLTKVYLAWQGGSSDIIEIPATAKVTIDGNTANRNDLKLWDVVVIGYLADTSDYSIVFVDATRKTVEGAVTATRKVYPGGKDYATIGGTEYRLSLTTLPAVGDVVKYGLNDFGWGYVPISYTVATDTWWLKSFSHNPDPLVGDSFVVDIGGTQYTYKGSGDYDGDGNIDAADLTEASTWLGKVCYVTLDSGRRITGVGTFEQCADCHGDFTGIVVSADATSGIVVLGDHPSPDHFQVITLPGLAVYELKATYNGDTGEWEHVLPSSGDHSGHLCLVGQWLGIGGLEIGDIVVYDPDHGILWVWNRNVDPIS